MIILILLIAIIAFLSLELIISGLQFAVIIVGAPFVIIYQLFKLLFNKGKKANENNEN